MPRSINGNNAKHLSVLLSHCSQCHKMLQNETLSRKPYVMGTAKSHRAKSNEYGWSFDIGICVLNPPP
jgi:hypothetical protein